MNGIYDAVCSTRNTLVILPLFLLCFLPIRREDIKASLPRLLWKTGISLVFAEMLTFFAYLFLPANAAALLVMLLFMIVFFWLYQREISVKRWHLWFIFCTACLAGSLSFLFTHVIRIFLYPEAKASSVIMDTGFLLFQLAFELAELLLLYHPFKKYLGWLIHYYDDEPVWKSIWLFPCCFTCLIIFFIPYNSSFMYAAVLPVLLALIIFTYILFYIIAYHIVEKREFQKKTAVLRLEAEQYQRLLLHVRKTRRLRHDFYHHLTVISDMAKNGEYQRLEEYLGKYSSSLTDMPAQYSDSPAVNAVLNHYCMICSEENIHAHISFCLKDIPSHMETDICMLLGSLLENAVEGLRKLSADDKYISLKAGQTAPHMAAILILSPCGDSSEKPDEGSMESVRRISARYNGFSEISCRDGIFEEKVLLTI